MLMATSVSCETASFPKVTTVFSENGIEWGDSKADVIQKMTAKGWTLTVDDPSDGFFEFTGGTFLGLKGGKAIFHYPSGYERNGVTAGRFSIYPRTYEEARRLYDTLAKVASMALGDPDHRDRYSERTDYRDYVAWGDDSGEWFPSSIYTLSVSVAARSKLTDGLDYPHFWVDYYSAVPD
jgi:hypothetical protein